MPVARLIGLIPGLFRNLARDERGVSTIFVAAAIVPMFGLAGLAIDAGRGYIVQARLHQAVDSAALAGGRVFFNDDRDAQITMYLNANFPANYMGATLSTPTITANEATGTVTVSATASISTTFLRVLGIDNMTVQSRTVVERADRGLELVLVMDTTGSMDSDDKLEDMQAAAHELLGILYGEKTSIDNLWIAVVPYISAVNVGASHTDWLAPGSLASLDYVYNDSDTSAYIWGRTRGSRVSSSNCNSGLASSLFNSTAIYNSSRDECIYGATILSGVSQGSCTGLNRSWDSSNNRCIEGMAWQGCVFARWDNGRDVTDDPPSVEPFEPYYYPWTYSSNDFPSFRDNVNNGDSPNKYCPKQQITPLTQSRSTIEAAIDDLVAEGGTNIATGMAWGFRVVSPRWSGLWGTADSPLPYDEPLMDKAVILLTDGKNDISSSSLNAYGFLSDRHLGTSNEYTAEGELDDRTEEICDNMKAADPDNPIIIYTIAFGSSVPANAEDLMRYCASSSSHYFDANSGLELSTAFKTIANELANLRIAE
ncbi:TadE/TadG family type IV pilus assembly protein [Oceanibacterium hippocampi]|uniref:Putative Flp pilus-assembly TadG-like N-terminal domain-containing protein n=1 Tax=Oceanibacterium hippocampi TaxID=745714 RepID=A0A1Y5SFF6_9PROT|nr:pilus assembly protein [Oceanibacterium hippocampi]SLN36439.1 hypothetical protein OCH7691_01474 [Oceanibacterium hippocampi]